MSYRGYGWAMSIILAPFAAHAEVMDKEPSLLSIWILCFAGIFLAFLSAKKSKWVAIITLPIMLFFASLIGEVEDPFVGPAILKEAGNIYIVSAYIAPLLVLFSLGGAFYIRRKKSKK
jgi:hypothetical protein